MPTTVPPPDLRRNIPLFIAFRVLFNARFYYPVLGVLFLDLGLSLAQYALLNVVWACTILLLEVPSGALADVLGRRNMVVLASVLMVLEMTVFAFAPAGDPALLFWLLVLNRVLSGTAEACASGADEALAFDSLPAEDRDRQWARVLESLMRWKSGAFFLAMLSGAALFDAAFIGSLVAWTGWTPDPASTLRWPVYATLGTAVLCLAVSLRMQEPPVVEQGRGPAVRAAWRNIAAGARHVAGSRRILFLILTVLVCDAFVRLFLTFASNYYRLIELPPFLNGILGSGIALLGFAAAPAARWMAGRFRAPVNLAVVGLLAFAGLAGMASPAVWWGAWVVVPLGLAMSGLQFFSAQYLNLWTPSEVRATVLSFRGVALNLGYAATGLLFAGLTGRLHALHPGAGEEAVFGLALRWLAPGFAACGLILLAAVRWTRRPRR